MLWGYPPNTAGALKARCGYPRGREGGRRGKVGVRGEASSYRVLTRFEYRNLDADVQFDGIILIVYNLSKIKNPEKAVEFDF